VGVITTQKRTTIATLVEKVLGPPSRHRTKFGLWWRCPICHADLALTADVWNKSWHCTKCKRHGDALDLLAAAWGISIAQAAARAGLSIPPTEPTKDNHHAKPKPRSTGHCVTGRRRR
jgi:hypothetical protein